MPLPKAILLDLDDTILTFNAGACWRAVCGKFVSALPGVTEEMLFQEIKRQTEWFWSDLERHRQGRLDMFGARYTVTARALQQFGNTDAELAAEMARWRGVVHEQMISPFPGALETMEECRRLGVRLALITNGAADMQYRKIDKYNLRSTFDCIMVEGEFGSGKPGFRVFHQALLTLGVEPKDAWMVGDQLFYDIAPAQALGITGIRYGHRSQDIPVEGRVAPDRVIESWGELLLDS